MHKFLHSEKAVKLAVQSHLQIQNPAVQSATPEVQSLAAQLLHLPEVFHAAADVTTLANQLNVITVRMENHSAFFLRILASATANVSEPRHVPVNNLTEYCFPQGKQKRSVKVVNSQ